MTGTADGVPFEELAAKARRIQQAVTLIRGRAESAGGGVTVEVDAAGHITDLHITDAALAFGADALAAAIAETQRAACGEAEAAAQDQRDELAADPRVGHVIDRLGSEVAAAQRLPVRSEEDEDRFYANMSILRST